MSQSTAQQNLEQVRQLTDTFSEDMAEYRQIAEAAKNLARAAEPLYDQSQHLLYISLILPIVRVAVDLKLFEILLNSVGSAYHY